VAAADAGATTHAPRPATPAAEPQTVVETELAAKTPGLVIEAVFLDPGGVHQLAVTRSTKTGAVETHYMHRWGGAVAVTGD
jgi:hypothetical protein